MKIPNYVNDLLGYQTQNGRRPLLSQIVDYSVYPGSIAGYLYKIKLERYRYPSCFKGKVERLIKWCNRMGAEAILHTVVENGWNTYAILSITDPVALTLEKLELVQK